MGKGIEISSPVVWKSHDGFSSFEGIVRQEQPPKEEYYQITNVECIGVLVLLSTIFLALKQHLKNQEIKMWGMLALERREQDLKHEEAVSYGNQSRDMTFGQREEFFKLIQTMKKKHPTNIQSKKYKL